LAGIATLAPSLLIYRRSASKLKEAASFPMRTSFIYRSRPRLPVLLLGANLLAAVPTTIMSKDPP
jgi:hypothetical protein